MKVGDVVENFTLQNQDGVVSVKAGTIKPFQLTRAAAPAHDFH